MTIVRDPISNKCTYNFITTADLCIVCFSYSDALAVEQMDTLSSEFFANNSKLQKKSKYCNILLPFHGWIVFDVFKNIFWTVTTFSVAILFLVLFLLPDINICEVSVWFHWALDTNQYFVIKYKWFYFMVHNKAMWNTNMYPQYCCFAIMHRLIILTAPSRVFMVMT